MKKVILMLLISAMVCVTTFAQEAPAAGGVTHGQLAQLMVKALGLARFVSAVPTDAEAFSVLTQNGIVPAEGWKLDGVVTKGDLARVMVLAMGLQDEVENPEDPMSWIATLQENGIQLDRISTSVQLAEVLPQGITQMFESTDPLVTRDDPPNPSGEFLPGSDAPLALMMGRVATPPVPPTPTPH